MEELQKIKEFKRVFGPRKHKVTKSLGVYDAYKFIRKLKWLNIGQALTEHLFYTIVRKCNEMLAADLIQGKYVTLPHNMGRLELRKSIRNISIVDGKLSTNLPIDWDRTLKLWAEEGKSKTLIRQEDREVFKVVYQKKYTKYNNKSFYEFTLNRNIKIALKNKIKNKQVDAFIL